MLKEATIFILIAVFTTKLMAGEPLGRGDQVHRLSNILRRHTFRATPLKKRSVEYVDTILKDDRPSTLDITEDTTGEEEAKDATSSGVDIAGCRGKGCRRGDRNDEPAKGVTSRDYADALMLDRIKQAHDAEETSEEFTKMSMIEKLDTRRKQLAYSSKTKMRVAFNSGPVTRSKSGLERNEYVLKRPFDSLASGLIGKRASSTRLLNPL